MTPEEKQLVFKVLCAMLPYEVVVHTEHGDIKLDRNHCGIGMLYYEHYSEEAKKECGYNENDCSIIISGCCYGDVKPYLRPISSMTDDDWNIFDSLTREPMQTELFDWLNAHHFDYRGLIEKGLALEAPKDMYKTK